MTPSLSIRFLIMTCAAVCSLSGVRGRKIELNWTSEGIKEYTSTPLMAELGDVLELVCNENRSNLFIQTERIQYDSCNASTGSGIFVYNGICFPGNPVMLTLTENSQSLHNTVNFVNDQVYFLTSYSNGEFRAGDGDYLSGGQCEDGLKMIIVIGDTDVPTSDGNPGGGQGPGPPAPTQLGLNDNNKSGGPTSGISLYIIVGAAMGALGLVVLCIVVITIAICVKRHRSKQTVKTDTNISYYGASSTAYFNEANLYDSGPDSRTGSLKKADLSYNLGSQPLNDVNHQENIQTDYGDANPTTFGKNKNHGSLDVLSKKPYKSAVTAGIRFDDATGQFSTPGPSPWHLNATPEHLLKSKSTSELSSPPTHQAGKQKPPPPPKPKYGKSSSADNLLNA